MAAGIAAVPAIATAETAPPTQTTASFTTTCHINAPNVAGVGGPMDITPDSPVNIHVTAPDTVDIGDRFDVIFDIDPISVPLDSLPSAISLKEGSRLKLDLQRPAGARLVASNFAGGNINVSQAQIITVNDAGAPDPNGNVLRLTDNGHHTVGNGGNAATKSHAGLGMHLAGATSLNLSFPRITLTFEAERAGAADIGVRTQGNAAAAGANPAAFLSLLASASVPLLGTQWVPGYCSPRGSASSPIDQNAAAMKTVNIVGLATSTALTGPDQVYLRTPAVFVATVDPRIPGEVTFVNGGQRVTTPVDTNTGEARAELVFNTQPTDPVTATFNPAEPRYATSRAELTVVPEPLATAMTLVVPTTTNANTRTALAAELPADARGTVTFTGGGQERTVDVRDGRAATSLTFTDLGEIAVQAVYAPSATSPYAPSTAQATITVEESTGTTLVLNGLDEPGYVAEPVSMEAVITPAEGTTSPQGRVEFIAGGQTRLVDVADGRAATEFTFGRAGNVEVTATYHPAGAGQSQTADSGTLEVVDAAVTDSALIGPAQIEPGVNTGYTIAVSPAGAAGAATVRIDGRVVAHAVPIVDGEGAVTLSFPPSTTRGRSVSIEFSPADPRILRPHTSQHTVQVAPAAVDDDALTMTITGPEKALTPNEIAPFRVAITPADKDLPSTSLNGYLTLANNGEMVRDAAGEPVRIAVVRGVADIDIAWTSGYPQSKYLQFAYHSADDVERVSAAITVAVTGAGDGQDGVIVDPDNGVGTLPGLGSLGSLTTIFGR